MVKIFWVIVGATLVPLGYEFLRTKKYLRPRLLDLRQHIFWDRWRGWKEVIWGKSSYDYGTLMYVGAERWG